MNITRENITETSSVIKLTLEKSDYSQRVADVLKSYQKKVNMPGFRPGKVPEGLIKKIYGKAILVDEVNKQATEALLGFISDNKIEILGEPLPSESQAPIDIDAQESFEFAFDIALRPAIDLKLNPGIEIPSYKIEVPGQLIKAQVDSLIGRFATNQEVEVAGTNSLVKGDLVKIEGDGTTPGHSFKTEGSVMSMAVFKDEAQKAKFLGQTKGSQVEFDPRLSFPNDTELSYLLKISKEDAAQVSGNYIFTISGITELVDPEINQELFDKIFGPGIVTNKEQMETRIKESIEAAFAMESDFRFLMDARAAITSTLDIQMPADFLKRWLKVTSEGNDKVTDENLEKDMPIFLEDLKWQLVKNEIVKTLDIKVEKEDLLAYAKKSTRLQFMQYGIISPPEEHIEGFALNMLENKEQERKLVDGAINDKIVAAIKGAVKVATKEVTREEFNKPFES